MTIASSVRYRIEDFLGLRRQCEHTFYAGSLGKDSVIVDLGGNRGEFSGALRREFGCRALAVEPVPALCAEIKRAGVAEVVNAAISDHDGELSFFTEEDSTFGSIFGKTSGSQGRLTVPCVTLESLLKSARLTSVDLLKIDIEGAEVPLFDSTSDETLLRMGQITVEFHDFIEKLNQAPHTDKIIARLEKLGFLAIQFGSRMDVLFVNTRNIRLPWFVVAYLRLLRFLFGATKLRRRR